jgi:hypothetical protein
MASVLAHNLVLIKMVDERGLGFASKYCNLLHTRLLDLQKAGTYADVSSYISSEIPEFISKLELELARSVKTRQPVVPPGKAAGKGAKGAKGAKTTPWPSSSGKGSKTSGKTQNKTKGASSSASLQICFNHDPKNGLVCQSGAACTREHLDTLVEPGATRFSRAKASFDSRQRTSGKGSH